MKIALSDIKIVQRDRKNFGDIKEMADSLARYGLLHPIIIDQDNVLVAGHRRLLGAMELGWSEIDVTRRDDLDEVQRKELELEENLRRKDLDWPEEARAVRDLFRMRQSKYGDTRTRSSGTGSIADQVLGETNYYSLDNLAEELDKAKSGVHFNIRLADALDELPEIEREPTRKAAWTRYLSWREKALREQLAKNATARFLQDNPPEERKPVDNGPNTALHQPIIKAGWRGKGLLYHADCRDVLKSYPSESVDAIITDPPFGLGMHKEGSTTGGKRLAESAGGMYDDDPHVIMDMLDEAFGLAERVLKPDGFVYCFFHMTRYEPLYLMLRKHFGKCNPVPIIWIKNTPGIGDPNKDWVYAYEPCFFVSRGNRSLIKPQAFNYLKYDTIPPSKKIHPTEKPASLLRHLISASLVKGEVVLDPFAGSASTLAAAYSVGCRFIGIEREESFYRAACENLASALAEETSPSQSDENAYEAAANLMEATPNEN